MFNRWGYDGMGGVFQGMGRGVEQGIEIEKGRGGRGRVGVEREGVESGQESKRVKEKGGVKQFFFQEVRLIWFVVR